MLFFFSLFLYLVYDDSFCRVYLTINSCLYINKPIQHLIFTEPYPKCQAYYLQQSILRLSSKHSDFL